MQPRHAVPYSKKNTHYTQPFSCVPTGEAMDAVVKLGQAHEHLAAALRLLGTHSPASLHITRAPWSVRALLKSAVDEHLPGHTYDPELPAIRYDH